MFEVTITRSLVATHQIRGSDGSLEPLHEHAWRVAVTVAGDKLDEQGVLVDFDALRDRLTDVLGSLDGRNLGDTPAFVGRSPSAENLALHLAEQLADQMPSAVRLKCVEVEEAPGCVARYLCAT